jgi:hypothetical protein
LAGCPHKGTAGTGRGEVAFKCFLKHTLENYLFGFKKV